MLSGNPVFDAHVAEGVDMFLFVAAHSDSTGSEYHSWYFLITISTACWFSEAVNPIPPTDDLFAQSDMRPSPPWFDSSFRNSLHESLA
jgi:hypothetical protein